jgi:serine/threonine-protein kinase RsbW
MPDEPWIWSLESRLPSRHGAGDEFQQQVLEQLQRLAWAEQDLFAVRLALEEALVNAIKHGNQLQEHKEVHILCKVSERCILIEIADEGPGFDPDDVPDPTAEERLWAPSGRGIMLMRCFMSSVEYNECGNRVKMQKHREAGEEEA